MHVMDNADIGPPRISKEIENWLRRVRKYFGVEGLSGYRYLHGGPTSPAARASSRHPSPVERSDGLDEESLPSRSSPEGVSEGWLGGRDSNPDKQSQSLLSYR